MVLKHTSHACINIFLRLKRSEEVEVTEDLIGPDVDVKVIDSTRDLEKVGDSCRNTDFRRFLSLESVNCDTRLVPYMSSETAKDPMSCMPEGADKPIPVLISSCTALPDTAKDNSLDHYQVPINSHQRKMSLSENALTAPNVTGRQANGCHGYDTCIHGNGNGCPRNGNFYHGHSSDCPPSGHNSTSEVSSPQNLRTPGKDGEEEGSLCRFTLQEEAATPAGPPLSCCARVWRAIRNSSVFTLLG